MEKNTNYPECCGKCEHWRIEDTDIICELTKKSVSYKDKLPKFCPYVLEQIKIKKCSNCGNLDVINGKNVYAWCPINKLAFEPFMADTRHACCHKWRPLDYNKEG